MPNLLVLTVEEPDRILNPGAYGAGALIRLQSATTEAGAFSDVSGTGSTPTTLVVTADRQYDAYDPNGTVSTWYRTRFENAGGTRLSDWSAAFQVSPVGSGLICQLADVKQALGNQTSSDDDETLIEHIKRIGAAIMGYTGRRFVRSPANGTSTFLFDVDETCKVLRVPRGIAEISQVEVATQTGGAYSVVSTSEWFADPAATQRDFGWPATRVVISDLSGSWFYQGKRTVRLTMAEGWDPIPPDIEGIAERAVVSAFLSKGSAAGGVVTIGPTGGTLVLRHISPADRATLDWYADIPA